MSLDPLWSDGWQKPFSFFNIEDDPLYLPPKYSDMRIVCLIILSLIFIFCSCSKTPEAVVEFCLELDETGRCKEPAQTFSYGSKIYVSCYSDRPFTGSSMKGNIYFLQGGERTYFNYKEFTLAPGVQTVHTYIPFDQFGGKGGFYVEFVDENGEILGGNDMKILE